MNHEIKKVVVISGGMGGVGRALCTKLAADGFNVVPLFFSTPTEEAESFIRTLTPGQHRALYCDLRDTAQVEEVFTTIRNDYGAIFAGIHAAVDPIVRKDLLVLETAELKNQLDVACVGGFTFFKYAIQNMPATEGRIIGILSRYIFSNTVHKKMGGYMLAKHALRGLLHELSLELVSSGIVVSAVAPEFLDTKLSGDLPQPVREFIRTRGVVGSMKTVDQVADAVSFLCGVAGASLHGKVFSFEEPEITSI